MNTVETKAAFAVEADDDQAKTRRNRLLLIGIDEYLHHRRLRNCVSDLKKFRDALLARFEFDPDDVQFLQNEKATKREILHALLQFAPGKDGARTGLTETDSLFIAFSGHGHFNPGKGTGFWIPVEAETGESGEMDFLSCETILEYLNPLRALQIVLLVDACFAGAFLQSQSTLGQRRIASLPSPYVLASGRVQPVSDGCLTSPFMERLLEALNKHPNGALSLPDLGRKVLTDIPWETNQTPWHDQLSSCGVPQSEFFLRLKPGMERPDPREEREAAFQSALQKQLDGQAAEIHRLTDLLERHQTDPDERRALTRQITLLSKQNDALEADRDDLARRLASTDPEQASAPARLALETFQAGNLDAALDCLPDEDLDRRLAEAQQRERQTAELKKQAVENFMVKARLFVAAFRFPEAEQAYLKAAAADETHLDHLDEAAGFFEKQNHFPQAIRLSRLALAAAGTEPQKARILNNLGNRLSRNKAFAEAEAAYREALNTYRALAEKNPDAFLPDVAGSLNNLGILLKGNQAFAAAEAAYREALNTYRALAEKNPDAFLPDVAMSLNNLGILLSDNQAFAAAEAAYREALNIQRALAEKNPDAFLPDVAGSLNNLGLLLYANQAFADAEAAFREALNIRRALAEKNPRRFNHEFSSTANNLVFFYQARMQHSLEVSDRVEALALLAASEEKLAIYPADLPAVKKYLGQIERLRAWFETITEAELKVQALEKRMEQESDPTRQAELLEEIVRLLERLQAASPEDASLAARLSGACGNLSWHALFARQWEQAEAAARRGLALDPSQEWIHTNLAAALLFSGKWEEAQAIYATWKAEPYDGERSWQQAFLDDLEELEKAGVTCPDVERARALLGE